MTQKTFTVPVDGIGTFVFRRSTLALGARILNEMRAYAAGQEIQDPVAGGIFEALATLKVLTVSAPEGWAPQDLEDPDRFDPLDPDVLANLQRVWGALREHEARFRRGPAAERPVVGAAAQPDGGVPVQAPVRPAAD